MDLSSLQDDPWPKGRAALDAIKADQDLSPRAARLLRDVTLLLAIVVLLFGLRPIATALKHEREQRPTLLPARVVRARPSAPLPFQVVMERFDQVRLFHSRERVEELLGPPSDQVDVAREAKEGRLPFSRLKPGDIGFAREHYFQGEESTHTWSDPKDRGKWVVIFFLGDTVFHKAKHGF